MRVPLSCVRFKHNCFVFEYDFRYPAFASNVNASLNAVNAEFLKLKLRRFQNSFALWRRPFSVGSNMLPIFTYILPICYNGFEGRVDEMMETVSVAAHYDALVTEGNDPVYDPEPLRAYMEKWDGAVFMERLALDGTQRALEIGVGTGRLARQVAPRCRSFVGIDLSTKTIARARENLAAFSNVQLAAGDFLSQAFEETFDVILSSLTFMHIREKDAAFRKTYALLASGGRFVLSIDKNQSEWLECGQRRVRLHPDAPEETEERLKRAGFRVESCDETEFAYIFTGYKEGVSC